LQDTYVYLTISCGAKVREVADSYQGNFTSSQARLSM